MALSTYLFVMSLDPTLLQHRLLLPMWKKESHNSQRRSSKLWKRKLYLHLDLFGWYCNCEIYKSANGWTHSENLNVVVLLKPTFINKSTCGFFLPEENRALVLTEQSKLLYWNPHEGRRKTKLYCYKITEDEKIAIVTQVSWIIMRSVKVDFPLTGAISESSLITIDRPSNHETMNCLFPGHITEQLKLHCTISLLNNKSL